MWRCIAARLSAPVVVAQVFATEEKYLIDAKAVKVARAHFVAAMAAITPAAHRAVSLPSAPLPAHLAPLLQPTLDTILTKLAEIFPPIADGAAPP